MEATVTLYRPTGPKELHLVIENGYRAWPPHLKGQPIFYPVLNDEYAIQIARAWNAKDPATGYWSYATRFAVRREFLARYEVHRVGGCVHDEYRIPAEDLEEFNRNIIWLIAVIGVYAAGDITRGTHHVKWACADGVMAALAVHRSLIFQTAVERPQKMDARGRSPLTTDVRTRPWRGQR